TTGFFRDSLLPVVYLIGANTHSICCFNYAVALIYD
ncbi:MAG: hypothetical protein ACI88H_002527, partial [Cocleimonas sp.]